MGRALMKLLLAILCVGPFVVNIGQGAGASNAVATCSGGQLHLEYSGQRVGTGNVNLIFLIKNVGLDTCTLRGFPRVSYVGPHDTRLSVPQTNSADNDGNDLGGLRPGVTVPTARLAGSHGVVSFSIYGRDETNGNAEKECINTRKMLTELPGVKGVITLLLTPVQGNFVWCGGITMHPIVPGTTGADPPNSFL
jgi:hypothetical protein